MAVENSTDSSFVFQVILSRQFPFRMSVKRMPSVFLWDARLLSCALNLTRTNGPVA